MSCAGRQWYSPDPVAARVGKVMSGGSLQERQVLIYGSSKLMPRKEDFSASEKGGLDAITAVFSLSHIQIPGELQVFSAVVFSTVLDFR